MAARYVWSSGVVDRSADDELDEGVLVVIVVAWTYAVEAVALVTASGVSFPSEDDELVEEVLVVMVGVVDTVGDGVEDVIVLVAVLDPLDTRVVVPVLLACRI